MKTVTPLEHIHPKTSQGIVTSAPLSAADKSTISDIVNSIYADIVGGVFKPGQKLRSDDLRQRYTSSVSTLREALSHLAAVGVVRAEAGRGFRVAPVSVEDLRDITALRLDMETKALADAMMHGDHAWEANIVATHHMMSLARVSDDTAVWTERFTRHARFHEALTAACRSPWLKYFRAVLFDQSERYRALYVLNMDSVPNRSGEHQQLMERVLARDIPGALAKLEQHIVTTSSLTEQMLARYQSAV